MSDFDLRRFHNSLRILRNIDQHETGFTAGQWFAFNADPYGFFIRADDETAEKLWRLIEARQPKARP
jgi:hypothetical protein